ncbi:hypothetical protein PN36_26735 [Candidatus Thiomargarita nelsonii]|uniref:Uncharacterized protein n=1 Tax=Candidatus Thiomargarita nelsonii TaxID=1003181 RepID=A0A0A6PCM0_9GAMM|nr:hypothetical protein PN36_26735 [Candidatus Thiomargarita nelsonii]
MTNKKFKVVKLPQARLRTISQLQQLQASTPTDLRLAHNLGVLCFWSASHLTDIQKAKAYWHHFIANWAIVLENDEFWNAWVTQRSHVYGEKISKQTAETARQAILERLLHSLSMFDSKLQSIYSGFPLKLTFHLEIKAIRLLKQAGGLQLDNDAADTIFCGPMMVRHLGLSSNIAKFIHDLPDLSKSLNHLFELFNSLNSDQKNKLSNSLNSENKEHLMFCFSELGPAFIHLDQGNPRKTLDLLVMPRCKKCGSSQSSPLSLAEKNIIPPRVCSENCAQFETRNPAYTQLDKRGKVLFQHALKLMAEAHIALVEQRIRENPPETTAMAQHWQDTLNAATEIDAGDQFQKRLIEMTVGRAIALERQKRLDDAISLLEAAKQLGEYDQINAKLAELLTDRGVKAGNSGHWDDAVTNLRQALELNPHVTRIRTNLIIALRSGAAHYFQSDNKKPSLSLLENARDVLQAGLEFDENNEKWQRELFEVRRELANARNTLAAGSSDSVEQIFEALFKGLDDDEPENKENQGGTKPTTGAGGRLDLLSKLAEAASTMDGDENDEPKPGSKSGTVAPAVAKSVQACLEKTGLKYRRQGENRYKLLFKTEKREGLIIQLQIVDDFVIILAPIRGLRDETKILYNLLRVTYTTDIHKICHGSDGNLRLVAEVPATVLTPQTLEYLIRDSINILDVSDQTFASFDDLKKHIDKMQFIRMMQTSENNPRENNRQELLASLLQHGDRGNNASTAVEKIQELCKNLRQCQCQRLSDDRFHLKCELPGLENGINIVVICNGDAASFIARMSGISPDSNNRRFYQRLAEINYEMNVCKVALDSDDELAFMYELPSLNEAVFYQMLERLREYVGHYGMELAMLA